jgi:hypothetical protein
LTASPQPPQVDEGQTGRRLALNGAGVLLLVTGILLKDGWPFMVGGFLLLIAGNRPL